MSENKGPKAAEAWQLERYNFSATPEGNEARYFARRVAELAETLTFEELGQQIRDHDEASVGRLLCALLTVYAWQSGRPPKWMTSGG